MEKNPPEKDDAATASPQKSGSAEKDDVQTSTPKLGDDKKSSAANPDDKSTPKPEGDENMSDQNPQDPNVNANPDRELKEAGDADQDNKKPDDGNETEAKNDGDPAAAVDPIPAEPEEDPSLDKVSEDLDRCISTVLGEKTENNDTGVNVPEELPKMVEKFLNLVEDEVIGKRDAAGDGRARWCQVPENDASFLEALDRIRRLGKYLSFLGLKFEENNGALLNRLGSIQHRALSYLEEEFRNLLEESRSCCAMSDSHSESKDQSNRGGGSSNKNPAEQDQDSGGGLPESDSDCGGGGDELTADQFPGYGQDIVNNLHKIAKEMISGGYETECCEVYTISRLHAVDETLHKLGLEKHSLDDIQKMHWESLEREIVAWVKAFKQCAAVYFSGERRLAEAVFGEYPSISSSLFSNLTRGVVIQLLNFAEGIAISKRSAEKLFKTLDMYETLREVVPKMDNLFPAECVNELKTEATTARSRLGEAAICIFCDLENSIKADTGRNRNPVPGGAVHPMTRYMMNYLINVCADKDTLELVFREHSKIERADSTSRPDHEYDPRESGNAVEEKSPFYLQLMRVMDLLDANLETKAKLYKDVALSSIFMMNNGRYILQKIKGSPEIKSCLGDTWCRRRSSDLRNYHKNYQRETWSRLLQCLTHEGLTAQGKVQKPVLKERFKSFNAMFDDIHKTQSTWVVSDEQLQSELRVSISAVVIPAYRSFLGRFSQILDPGRQTEKYIKFQPEDIETYIDELFDGNPNSSIFKKKP